MNPAAQDAHSVDPDASVYLPFGHEVQLYLTSTFAYVPAGQSDGVGLDVGSAVGRGVGSEVGLVVGERLGASDGSDVGSSVGVCDGSDVGITVGGRVVVMMSMVLVSTATVEPRLSVTAV
jgi:hypothetical protein